MNARIFDCDERLIAILTDGEILCFDPALDDELDELRQAVDAGALAVTLTRHGHAREYRIEQ